MDHQRIDEHSVAEAYVLGRLPPGEATEFEEHLLTCAACRERVAAVEELRGALQAMAADDRRRVVQAGLVTWLARRRRALSLGLAAGLAVFAAALLLEDVRLRRQLAAAHLAAIHQAAVQRPTPPQQASPPSAPQRAEASARERQRLEPPREGERLREAERRNRELAARLAELLRPEVNVAIVSLGQVRGEVHPTQVALGKRSGWIVLSLELPAPGSGTYRATLLNERGRTVWEGDGLRPTAADTLLVAFHSSLLAPAAYRLRIQGAGTPEQGTEIPFQAVQ